MDLRDTSDFGWTTGQIRARRDVLGDLEVEIVTRSPADAVIRETSSTTAPLTVATPISAAVRVLNRVEGRSAVFSLDGLAIDDSGWRIARAATIGTLKAANGLLERWVSDPAALQAAGLP